MFTFYSANALRTVTYRHNTERKKYKWYKIKKNMLSIEFIHIFTVIYNTKMCMHICMYTHACTYTHTDTHRHNPLYN